MKYTLLNWIWAQPQTLIGFIIFSIAKRNKKPTRTHKDISHHVFLGKLKGGAISLGPYCIHYSDVMLHSKIKHEHGYTIQSMILGPLYLLLIGIPSFTWSMIVLLVYAITKKVLNYYAFPTEKWADKLGGNK